MASVDVSTIAFKKFADLCPKVTNAELNALGYSGIQEFAGHMKANCKLNGAPPMGAKATCLGTRQPKATDFMTQWYMGRRPDGTGLYSKQVMALYKCAYGVWYMDLIEVVHAFLRDKKIVQILPTPSRTPLLHVRGGTLP